MKKIACLILFLSQLFLAPAWAQQSFVVKQIDIEGLQNLRPATVENSLPVKRGNVLKPSESPKILRALYNTGFFDDISLSRHNNTLVIHVVERPIIGQLKITGNSTIPTDKLTDVLRSLGVMEGRIYNPVVLDKIKQSLLNQYYQLGRYNARVDVNSVPLPHNRVAVTIDISEGLVAKIRRITVIGNHVFSENTLVKQLAITPSGLFTFITQTDRYSEDKVDASIQQLRNYYMDRGYLHFNVVSSQAEITPDRKGVYVTIVVSEGDKYTFKGYNLTGNLIVPRPEMDKVVAVHAGDVFSRQAIIDSQKAITKLLGDMGYLFTSVNIDPQVDENARTVFVVFNVTPNRRVYVRHITFSDNSRTNDVVLRREIQQMESAPAASSKLDDSKQRLSLLPYIKDVNMTVNPVENTPDKVDVNYQVTEQSSATATAKLGYSDDQGLLVGAGVDQKNFLGTGNTLGVNFDRSSYQKFYGIDYTNPYYTDSGISRSFSIAAYQTDPGSLANLTNAYTMNEYDAGVLYGIPMGNTPGVYNRISVGLSYQNVLLNLISGQVTNQVQTFVNEFGRHFQEADIKLGYSRDSRDKAVFPTSGSLETLFFDGFAPLDHNSLTFYMVNYHAKWYLPLSEQFILITEGNLGYGNSLHGAEDFPFFKNFYAGGIDSVRGYSASTLGPRDSLSNSMGGNELIDARIVIIFPNYISDNVRTTFFVDAGNVYTSYDNRKFGCSGTNTGQCSTNGGPLRYSVGIEADMLTPIGPVKLSVAKPFERDHDKINIIQFALSSNF